MKVGRRMHPFVQIFFLNVGVTIDMNDPNVLGRDTGNSSDRGKANAVIASQNNGKGSRRTNVRNGIGNLIKGFFQIGRNGKDIAGIAQGHLFSQINALFVIVGRVQGGNPTNALGTKARPGTVGTSSIKGNADDGGIVIAHEAGVFDVGSLEKGINAGKVGQFSTRKGRNGLVFNATGTGQAHFQIVGDFSIMNCGRNGGFL